MERVLYNTVLGALPIRPDGHAFYYSDTCFTDPQGIFVNLHIPSVVHWTQNGAPCSLSIETDYPYDERVRGPSRSTCAYRRGQPARSSASTAGTSPVCSRRNATLTAHMNGRRQRQPVRSNSRPFSISRPRITERINRCYQRRCSLAGLWRISCTD
jgi:hypothetical protein